MKVMFLDNDGVICLSNNWGSRAKKRKRFMKENPHFSNEISKLPVKYRFDNFDKKAINVLNQIIEESDCEIVVSSDWKLHANLRELGEYYNSQGIIKRPIDITPKMEEFDLDSNDLFMWNRWLERKRILEIKKYLSEHPEVTHWVAVDDLNMSNESNGNLGLDNFVLTPRSLEGIKQSGIKEKVLRFLVDQKKRYISD
jgi:hypothetical protein